VPPEGSRDYAKFALASGDHKATVVYKDRGVVASGDAKGRKLLVRHYVRTPGEHARNYGQWLVEPFPMIVLVRKIFDGSAKENVVKLWGARTYLSNRNDISYDRWNKRHPERAA
jgi:hypothetical protein